MWVRLDDPATTPLTTQRHHTMFETFTGGLRALAEGVRTLSAGLRLLREDARTAYDRDPAADHPCETLLYPGVHALWAHRIASSFHDRGHPVLARACSRLARLLTGVDVHPAADVGRRVFVDHAIGVVVGATAEIGDDVLVYHGVTLGAREETDGERHPTVRDGATLGANATILGSIEIGSGATVGAGSVVLDDVPPETTVAGVPAERIHQDTSDYVGDDGRFGSTDDRTTTACGPSNGD